MSMVLPVGVIRFSSLHSLLGVKVGLVISPLPPVPSVSVCLFV